MNDGCKTSIVICSTSPYFILSFLLYLWTEANLKFSFHSCMFHFSKHETFESLSHVNLIIIPENKGGI